MICIYIYMYIYIYIYISSYMHMYTRKSVIYVFCMSAHTHVCIYKYTHLLYTYIFRYYMIHIYCICFFWTSPATLDIGIHALHIFIRRNPPEHLLSIQLQRCCRWLQAELPDRSKSEMKSQTRPTQWVLVWNGEDSRPLNSETYPGTVCT